MSAMKTLYSLALIASFAVGTAQANCTYPKAPDAIPDGSSASLQEMVAAQRAVKQFDADITVYQACVEKEHKDALAANSSLTGEQKAEREKIVVQKLNAAVDDAQLWADRLNAQIRVYRETSAKKN